MQSAFVGGWRSGVKAAAAIIAQPPKLEADTLEVHLVRSRGQQLCYHHQLTRLMVKSKNSNADLFEVLIGRSPQIVNRSQQNAPRTRTTEFTRQLSGLVDHGTKQSQGPLSACAAMSHQLP